MPHLGDFGVMDVVFDARGRLFASGRHRGLSSRRARHRGGLGGGGSSGSLAGERGLAPVQTAAGLVFSADGSKLDLPDYHGFDRDRSRILVFAVNDGQLQTPKVIDAEGALFAARSPTGNVWFSSGFSGRLWVLSKDGAVPRRRLPGTSIRAGALAFGGGSYLFTAGWYGEVGEIAPGETPSFH